MLKKYKFLQAFGEEIDAFESDEQIIESKQQMLILHTIWRLKNEKLHKAKLKHGVKTNIST